MADLTNEERARLAEQAAGVSEFATEQIMVSGAGTDAADAPAEWPDESDLTQDTNTIADLDDEEDDLDNA